MRHFNSGATRDSDDGKLKFTGFLSFPALERYARYMDSHRVQSDGSVRDPGNWKKGIPTDAYCDSLVRHSLQAWGTHDGQEVRDEKGHVVDLEEALCAVIFNAFGWLHEVLRHSRDSSPTSSPGTPSPS